MGKWSQREEVTTFLQKHQRILIVLRPTKQGKTIYMGSLPSVTLRGSPWPISPIGATAPAQSE